jgi:hypothetical protein
MVIGGVLMLFVSAFLMAEHARAATESVPILTLAFNQVQSVADGQAN